MVGHVQKVWETLIQRRIFIFEALGYFTLGTLLEGSRRLLSYKLALHVLVTFTEQVFPIHEHINLFWVASTSGTKTVTMKLTKKAAVKLSDHTPIIKLNTSLGSCNFWKCIQAFCSIHYRGQLTILKVIKRECSWSFFNPSLIFFFNPSRSFFYSRPAQRTTRAQRELSQL